MKLFLTITAGPHTGKEFCFEGRDSFMIGRSKDAHFQLSYDDPYFSRRHFVIELNPPRCRLLDLHSRNGVLVNGKRVTVCELVDGDEVKTGHTVFRVRVEQPDPDKVRTLDLPSDSAPSSGRTSDYQPVDRLTDGYEVGKELGRGGMGVVYKLRRRSDDLPAAIKIITPTPGANKKQIDRFLREAKILGSLTHPNVVGFLEAGECAAGLFIAMEYVDGADASQILAKRGPQTVGVAVRLMCHVLAGLSHAHETGFVHRDVKPSNILIGRAKKKRCVKIADFGLARAFQSSQLSGMTLNGDIGGTPAFMPPEQVTHYRDVGPAADQYSAAATLYFLLTSRHAYDFVKETGGRLVQILTEDPIPIRQRRADIPLELAEVIHRAMSRDPADRFASATLFRMELMKFV